MSNDSRGARPGGAPLADELVHTPDVASLYVLSIARIDALEHHVGVAVVEMRKPDRMADLVGEHGDEVHLVVAWRLSDFVESDPSVQKDLEERSSPRADASSVISFGATPNVGW